MAGSALGGPRSHRSLRYRTMYAWKSSRPRGMRILYVGSVNGRGAIIPIEWSHIICQTPISACVSYSAAGLVQYTYTIGVRALQIWEVVQCGVYSVSSMVATRVGAAGVSRSFFTSVDSSSSTVSPEITWAKGRQKVSQVSLQSGYER